MKTILITGAAGFIGFSVTKQLLNTGYQIIGIDSVNDYYDPQLKRDRLTVLGVENSSEWGKPVVSSKDTGFTFYRSDISDGDALRAIFSTHRIDIVLHLAAQAGVRYSLTHPEKYIESNIQGFFNVLECSKQHNTEHFIYASSSSVYGLNTKMPLSVTDNVDNPISLYAATKKSNELFAHTYSHLYHLPTTGLRFFTVYGPWGRPDMAYFKFTKAILNDEVISVFNNGDMYRDFTYIDDIVEGVQRLIHHIPGEFNPERLTSGAPYSLYNIGNHTPIRLMDFIQTLENVLGKKAIIDFQPMQPGDVYKTFADISQLERDVSYKPNTSLKVGIEEFVRWYLEYNS